MESRFKIEEIKQRDNKNKALNNWDSSDRYIKGNVNRSTNEHIIEMIKIYLKVTFIFIIILFIIAFLVIKIRAANHRMIEKCQMSILRHGSTTLITGCSGQGSDLSDYDVFSREVMRVSWLESFFSVSFNQWSCKVSFRSIVSCFCRKLSILLRSKSICSLVDTLFSNLSNRSSCSSNLFDKRIMSSLGAIVSQICLISSLVAEFFASSLVTIRDSIESKRFPMVFMALLNSMSVSVLDTSDFFGFMIGGVTK